LPTTRNVKQRVAIQDAVVKHGNDPFGQVFDGWIRVTGPFIENVDPATGGTTQFLDRVEPDYPQETRPGKVHCLLLGEKPGRWAAKYFLLLVLSSKDPKLFERWGMGMRSYDNTSEQWQEKTITII
jgi:hypothetical protein